MRMLTYLSNLLRTNLALVSPMVVALTIIGSIIVALFLGSAAYVVYLTAGRDEMNLYREALAKMVQAIAAGKAARPALASVRSW